MSTNISGYVTKIIQLKNGQKLVLREPKIEDAKKMIEYLNAVGGESENLLFGKGEFRLTVEEEMEYIKSINKNSNILMILGIINDNIVSISQVSSSNKIRITHNSEIAISVKKDNWRNGIGYEVMRELIKSQKESGIVKNITLGVKASNKNAISMYKKVGFEKVGVHKNYFNINGTYDDEILMDLYI